MLDYVDYSRDTLQWIVTENVRNMCHKRKQFGGEIPIEIQNEALKERGFMPAYALVNTTEFGLPQSRTRCYGLYIKEKCWKIPSCPETVFRSMKRQALPSHMALLKDDPVIDGRSRKGGGSGDKWKVGFEEALKAHGKAP